MLKNKFERNYNAHFWLIFNSYAFICTGKSFEIVKVLYHPESKKSDSQQDLLSAHRTVENWFPTYFVLKYVEKNIVETKVNKNWFCEKKSGDIYTKSN